MKSKVGEKFHRDLGLPDWLDTPSGEVRVKYTKHSVDASLTDRYGKIHLEPRVNIDKSSILEVEMGFNDVIRKVLVRTPYQFDARMDLLLALIPERDGYVCKTVWLNRKEDNHATLRTNAYSV